MTVTAQAQQVAQEAWASAVAGFDATCRELPEPEREIIRRFLTRLTGVIEHTGHDAPP